MAQAGFELHSGNHVSHVHEAQAGAFRQDRFARAERATMPGGQDRAYKHALRHSGRVRLLKVLLPATGLLVVLGLFVAYVWSTAGVTDVNIGSAALEQGRMVMSNPEVNGFDDNKRPYNVTASRATQDPRTPRRIELEQINAKVPMTDALFATISAGNGLFDADARKLDLGGTINVRTDDGVTMRLEDAFIDIASGLLKTDRPVELESSRASISADSFTIEDNGRRVIFENRVRMTLHPENAATAGSTQPGQ